MKVRVFYLPKRIHYWYDLNRSVHTNTWSYPNFENGTQDYRTLGKSMKMYKRDEDRSSSHLKKSLRTGPEHEFNCALV